MAASKNRRRRPTYKQYDAKAVAQAWKDNLTAGPSAHICLDYLEQIALDPSFPEQAVDGVSRIIIMARNEGRRDLAAELINYTLPPKEIKVENAS